MSTRGAVWRPAPPDRSCYPSIRTDPRRATNATWDFSILFLNSACLIMMLVNVLNRRTHNRPYLRACIEHGIEPLCAHLCQTRHER